jgi:two-component system phosphate regulon response regulator PhoB
MSGSPLAVPRPRVLLVDPDADSRALYERSFMTAGFDVAHAADGRDALTKALVRPPSLVVMELSLPHIDGVALCEILRRDRVTRATPILVVTAELRPVELERARRAGADDVLVKPVPLDILAQRAAELVASPNDSRREAELARGRSPREEPARRPLSKATRRELTMTPPLVPPALTCPTCDRTLTYHVSQTGGVSDRHAEQWDYFSCPACGAFQFRQRTRKLRRLEASEEQWLQRQRASGLTDV